MSKKPVFSKQDRLLFSQLHSSLPHNSTLIPQSDRTRLLFIRLILTIYVKKLIFGIRFCNMISVAIINNGFYNSHLKITIMKKVLVTVALVMGLGSSVAFAEEVINTTSVEMQAQVPQDEFTKIDVKELPEAVAQAVAKNYEGATIKRLM